MDIIKASVIIPIYNSEKYLHECIESAIQQSEKNIEIILVNDGSSDGSFGICQDYKTKDDRIHLINKENGGLSSARNAGLAVAKGEYICFLDSDDYLNHEMVKVMLELAKMKKADICSCGYIKVNDNGEVLHTLEYPLNQQNCYDQVEIHDYLNTSHQSKMLWYVWRNIYRKEMLNNNNIRFDEKMKFAEDSIFNLNAYYCAERMTVVKKNYYHYRDNMDSLTSQKGVAKQAQYIEMQYSIKKKFYDKHHFKPQAYKDLAISVVEHTLLRLLNNHKYLDYASKKEKRIGLKEIYKSEMIQISLDVYKLSDLKSKTRGVKMVVLLSKLKLYTIINILF